MTKVHVELVVHGDTGAEIIRKAKAALEEFFGDTDYEWSIDCEARHLTDGTIMGFRAQVTGEAEA